MRSDTQSGNRGVGSDRGFCGTVVALMEGVVVVDGLERVANAPC